MDGLFERERHNKQHAGARDGQLTCNEWMKFFLKRERGNKEHNRNRGRQWTDDDGWMDFLIVRQREREGEKTNSMIERDTNKRQVQKRHRIKQTLKRQISSNKPKETMEGNKQRKMDTLITLKTDGYNQEIDK